MPDETATPVSSERLLLVVQGIRSHIPGWTRSLSDAATEATDKEPDYAKVDRLLHDPDTSAPRKSAAELRAAAQEAGTTPNRRWGSTLTS
jgi:hypothetical protein